MAQGLARRVPFNTSVSVLIPTVEEEQDAHGVTREAGDTKPLSLKRISNKIIAASLDLLTLYKNVASCMFSKCN